MEKVPKPPSEKGVMLEWFYPDRTSRIVAGALVSVFIFAMYVFRSGFTWVDNLWLWGLVLLPVPVLFLASRTGGKSAGADWLAVSDKDYVKTYELTKATVHVDGVAHVIQMVDSSGRSARPRVDDLQANHRLWDLVYNGILHSVHVGGAETNKRARDYLLLDHPPTLRPQ
ncbi:hypothetical protein [Prauserella halophila]|uniref:hypothetical protein n=1 Tax=Prauserella halophila TaxID=185641 RepID=UPI0020A4CA25|nr:hypothetical protein [Prauserella halophila]MCP2236826.1 hypothetical protein [Prauserella halophila]